MYIYYVYPETKIMPWKGAMLLYLVSHLTEPERGGPEQDESPDSS